MKMLSPEKPQTKNIYFVAMLMAAAPTGGVVMPMEVGYSASNIRVISEHKNKTSPAGQLDNARDGLDMTVTALCKVFGVSRQTYYNWANGDAPATASRNLLASLSGAADLLRDLPGSKSVLLSQPVRDGKNFWRLVSEGVDAKELAQVIRDRTQRRAGERVSIRQAIERKKNADTLKTVSDEFVG
jgi:DNA-binding XRE family transcriptional regulator